MSMTRQWLRKPERKPCGTEVRGSEPRENFQARQKEGKGAGKKGGKDKGKKEAHGETDKKPRKFYNTTGGCTRGSTCPFSHKDHAAHTVARVQDSKSPMSLTYQQCLHTKGESISIHGLF